MGEADNNNNTPKGVLLFAHGSSKEEWRNPFDRLLMNLKAKRPQIIWALGFLERTQPDFYLAIEQLLAEVSSDYRNAQKNINMDITVMPLFLAPSTHISRDIPKLIAKVLQDYPLLKFTIRASILENECMYQALEDSLSDSLTTYP